MWDKAAMEQELKILHRDVFRAGSVIIREGTSGSRAFIVESGKVAIWRDVDGKRHTLGVIGEGGIFGEMALIDNQPRMASASAIIDTTCLVVGEEIFKKKLAAADPFLVGLLRIFVRNIRSLTEHYQAEESVPADDNEDR